MIAKRVKDNFNRAFDEVNDYIMSAEKMQEADKYENNVYLSMMDIKWNFENLCDILEDAQDKASELMEILYGVKEYDC